MCGGGSRPRRSARSPRSRRRRRSVEAAVGADGEAVDGVGEPDVEERGSRPRGPSARAPSWCRRRWCAGSPSRGRPPSRAGVVEVTPVSIDRVGTGTWRQVAPAVTSTRGCGPARRPRPDVAVRRGRVEQQRARGQGRDDRRLGAISCGSPGGAPAEREHREHAARGPVRRWRGSRFVTMRTRASPCVHLRSPSARACGAERGGRAARPGRRDPCRQRTPSRRRAAGV
jgi:hypothetical protein